MSLLLLFGTAAVEWLGLLRPSLKTKLSKEPDGTNQTNPVRTSTHPEVATPLTRPAELAISTPSGAVATAVADGAR